MKDHAGEIFLLNGVKKTKDMKDALKTEGRTAIYEVIRMIQGVPLFMEDHYKRMENSAKMAGFQLQVQERELQDRIKELLAVNHKDFCNVKVMVYHDAEGQDCLLYISKSYYPSEEEINKGIAVSLFHWERNDPNIKRVNSAYKDAVAKAMKEQGVFELLLVNDGMKITEGSRSNVFFIRDGTVFTAPGEYVLKGVTRRYVMEACRRCGLQVVETLTSVEDLKRVEGLFLSGTSIKVLPIAQVDDMEFASSTHPLVLAVRKEYDGILDEYIRSKKTP